MTTQQETPKITNIGCDCGNPRERQGCRCNSMSIQPCSWCDWNSYHGSEQDCEYARYWCEGCEDYCEAERCSWCEWNNEE
jgi:hypothetical protein